VDNLTSGFTQSTLILGNTVDNTQSSLVINQHSFMVFGTYTNPASIFISPDTITRGSSIALSDNINQTGSIFSLENSLQNGISGAQGNGLNIVNNIYGGSILTLTTAGNVGIQNTNPTSALDVSGVIKSTSISTGTLNTSTLNASNLNVSVITVGNIITTNIECTGITVTNLTVPGESIFNSLSAISLSSIDSTLVNSNITTAKITTGNILTGNITQANIIVGVINNVSTGNCHINGSLGINNVSTTCKINITDTSTNNTVLLENTNSSSGSYIEYKYSAGYSWVSGVPGVNAGIGNSFVIRSDNIDTSSKFAMRPGGQIQIGTTNVYTSLPSARLVVEDISSGFISFIYQGAEIGNITRNAFNNVA
jgi:hypothetical protein